MQAGRCLVTIRLSGLTTMTHPPQRKSSVVRALTRSAVLLTLLIGGALGVMGLTKCQPAAYIPSDPNDPAVARRGEALENAAAAQLTGVRSDAGSKPGTYVSAPWSVAITQEDANAWLATRLPEWLRSRGAQMPAGLGTPSVRAVDGVLMFCAPMSTPAGVTIVSFPVTLSIVAGGGLEVMFGTTWAGLMPVPGASSAAVTAVRAALKDQSDSEAVVIRSPVMSVDDGRQVRLTGVRSAAGRLELTFQTEGR